MSKNTTVSKPNQTNKTTQSNPTNKLSTDQLIRRWMFYNCPKLHSWIVYQNIRSILDGTEYKVAPGHNEKTPYPGPKIITLQVPVPVPVPKSPQPTDPPSTTPPEMTTMEYLSHIEPAEIKYVHSVIMTSNELYCLLETAEGVFTIENRKEKITPPTPKSDPQENQLKTGDMLTVEKEDGKEVAPQETVKSTLTFYDNLEHFMNSVPKTLLKHLEIKKLSNLKLDKKYWSKVTPAEFPTLYKNKPLTDADIHQYLSNSVEAEAPKPGQETQHLLLDLSYNFQVKADHLKTWTPTPTNRPTKLILNTCWQLRNPTWATEAKNWTDSIRVLELINLPQLTNEMTGELLQGFPNLEDLYLHQCSKLDIKVLLSIFGNNNSTNNNNNNNNNNDNKLRSLCLNNQSLVCQPNEYAGMITNDEWNGLRNYRLEKLFINSGNLSLDVIDYLKTSFVRLQNLIIRDDIYNNLKKNMTPGSHTAKQITICSTEGKKFEISRDFTIRNLLRNRYQSPFSDAMQKIMKAKYEQQEKGTQDDDSSGSYEWVEGSTTDDEDNDQLPKNTIVCKK
jgi:hypothetical protein